MGRAMHLWILSLRGSFRRFYADLASQMTVLVAAAVLLATFFYMFNDFLNTEVRSLSTAMRDTFAQWLVPVTLLGAWGTGIQYGRNLLYGPGNMAGFVRSISEEPEVPRWYSVFSLLIGWMVLHGIAWLVVFNLLVPYSTSAVVIIESVMVLSGLILQFWPPPRQEENTNPPWFAAVRINAGKLPSMRRLRLIQMFSRNRLCQVCFGCAVLFWGFLAYGATASTPAFVSAAAGMVSGLFLASAMAVQMAADMEHIWSERIMGISHEDYQKTYNGLGLQLGTAFILMALMAVLLMRGVPSDLTSLGEIFSIALAGGSYPIMLPWVAMQIDPRKVAVPVITIFILGLFVGTVILVNPLLVLLLPFLKYYAEKSQDGRYYRA